MAELLAKSEPQVTLSEHIYDCLRIRELLFTQFPNVEKVVRVRSDFWELLRLAIIFHDLGKAHREFQKLLSGNKNNEWHGQRHELFSLPFLEAYQMPEEGKTMLRMVIAAHHKDLERLRKEYILETYLSKDEEDEGVKFNFLDEFRENVDFNKVRELLSKEFQITLPPPRPYHPGELVNPYVNNRINARRSDYWDLLLLFGALKHCDHLGSARIEKLEQIQDDNFEVLDRIRLKLHSTGKDFYIHQQLCADALGSVILTAPTGSGKTESALLWLRNQMREFGHGRVFYLLPFTASINAMFERLGSSEKGLGEGKVGVVHGKLNEYLFDYFEDFQYTQAQRKEEIKSLRDKFRTLQTPFKVATPFQLLKHIFGLKGFEQGIFEMSGGYFIFDEIHAYSPDVFAQILVLLEFITQELQGKVLIMTATLPSFLRIHLQRAIGNFSSIHADENLYQSFDRHRVRIHNGLINQNLEEITKFLDDGKKVLVVCNTVKQAQEVYHSLLPNARHHVLLHGGFNGRDRIAHERILKEFEFLDNAGSVLLVGTQAIEVSLDIDYDIIFTEPAPLDALIQRFGRVNRKREKGICSAVVFSEKNSTDKYIYPDQIVDRTLNALKRIIDENDGLIHESQLESLLNYVYPDWNPKDKQTFETTYDFLKASLEGLIPMLHSKRSEEEFYSKFDGIKVLPAVFQSEYTGLLNDFRFIEAERLKVQIRRGKFAQLTKERDDNLQKKSFAWEAGKKLIQVDYWVIHKKYFEDIGIDYNSQEEWSFDNHL